MALINNDVILNSNPTKKLRIAFENMKFNYTDATAQAYMDTYKDQPLAFIIENSRYIFSEPKYGLQFYIESVLSNEYAFLFTEYENEKEKIDSYIEENGTRMPDAQRALYTDLLNVVTEKCNAYRNTSFIVSHACLDTDDHDAYMNLVESVYQFKSNPEKIIDIQTFMESTSSADLFYALSPYLMQLTNDAVMYEYASNLPRFFKECTITDRSIDGTEWKHYIESSIIVSKLCNDSAYKLAVDRMPRRQSMIIEGLAMESVKNQIDELFIEHVVEGAHDNEFNRGKFDCHYSSSTNAVNRIFMDDDLYEIMREDNEKFKQDRRNLYGIAMNTLFEYVTHEYHTCDDTTDKIVGYNYFAENTDIESAFMTLSQSEFIVKESDEEDDIEDEDEDTESKKANAPTDKNLATKIQNKAMDTEADFLQKRAENQKKGQEIRNAIKATSAIPSHILNSIKNTIAEFDKMDDERRKEYIIKPGYRKKIFRNLKVALMYGAGASIHMASIPAIFIARRLSKHKDRRIRNELVRELDTNIKVCDEKINDANADGNKQEKYRLMRIKSQLEKEALRVKTNSKYV